MAKSTGESAAVLVTGASSGIGEACVRELDRKGFRVFAGVRSEAAAGRLRESSSGRLTPLMLDVTEGPSIAAAAGSVQEAVGGTGLAGLVNNAGIAVGGPLEFVPVEQLRRQFEVNVIGQIAVTQAFLPMLRAAKGRIVYISSISAAAPVPYLGPYSASKFALEALCDALRVEVRRFGISVSLVEPAAVETPIWKKSQSGMDRMIEQLPPEGIELYQPDFDAARRRAEEVGAAGMPVQWPVRAVLHALTARRPKTRYPITWESWFAFRVFRVLPDRVRDWLLRRELGLR